MELTKVKEKILNTAQPENGFAFKPVIKHLLSFTGGFLLMNPYVLGQISPFSLSLTAALDETQAFCSCAGGILGSFVFFDGIMTLKYVAVSIIFMLIKGIFGRFPELNLSRIFTYINAFLCTFFIGIAIMFAAAASPEEFLTVSYESALTCVGAYIFENASEIIWGKHGVFRLSTAESAQIIIVAGVLLMHVYKYKILAFSPVITVFCLFILMFSKLKNEIGGALSGICLAAASGLSGDFGISGIGIALGGLAAGTLSRQSRHLCAAGFFIPVLLCTFADGSSTAYMMPVEALLACSAFLIIPERLFAYLRGILNPSVSISVISEDSRTVSKKLLRASESIGQISDCVSGIRSTLKTPPDAQIKSAVSNTWEKVCGECEFRESCPAKIKNPPADSLERIASELLAENGLNKNILPSHGSDVCRNAENMFSQLQQTYSSFAAGLGAQGQISQLQELMSDQFRNVSEILRSIADDIADGTDVNSEAADRCAAEARELGLDVIGADSRTDRLGRFTFSLKTAPDSDFDIFKLTEVLSLAAGTTLNYPEINEYEDCTELIFNQKISFDIKIGAFSRPKDGENICGDYYRSFRDENDRYIIILSDGMGTGAMAAVDSAMAAELFSKLVRSGLSFDCALPITNSALLVKSNEESLSTLDAACVDLYSGKAEFFKAGAAVTFIRHRGQVVQLEEESMPLGILSSVSFSREEIQLEKNDIILMVSDGILGDSSVWIQQELKLWHTDTPAQKLAEYIVESAAERKTPRHRDDMTAVAVYII